MKRTAESSTAEHPPAADRPLRPTVPDAVVPTVPAAEPLLRRIVPVIDAGMLGVSIALTNLAAPDARSLGAGWTVLFLVLVFVLLRTRTLTAVRNSGAFVDELPQLLTATGAAAILLLALEAVGSPGDDLAGPTAVLWAVGATCLAVGRLGLGVVARVLRHRGIGGVRTLIVGAGEVGQKIAQHLLERPELGLRPIGFLDREPLDRRPSVTSVPVLGASWDFEDVARRHGVQHVVIAFSSAPHTVLADLVNRCARLQVPVSVVPRLFEQVSRRITIEHIGGIPLVRCIHPNPDGWEFSVKHALDRMVAAVLLVILAPVLGVIALAVKCSSEGPVLYARERVGRDRRPFSLLKFRTMMGSPEIHGEADLAWLFHPAGGSRPPIDSDLIVPDRRTPVGRILRRYSLDELPQLWNVLTGDMSLVGPRPERLRPARHFELEIYRYGDRHRVKPGLTGWAQVQGLRGRTSLEDRVEWDNHYIENWSFWFDLKILWLTIPEVIRAHDAE